MRVLVIDFAMIYFDLASDLDARGGEVVHSYFERALSDLQSNPFDAVIVDVNSLTDDDPDPYSVIAAIVGNPWSDNHRIVVYTQTSRDEFTKRATAAGCDLEKIDYYSKRDLEIPPILKFAREKIHQNPYIIGWDMEISLPTAITEEWISNHPSPYGPLCQHLAERLEEDGDEPDERPAGQLLLRFFARLEGEVGNGGFHQYFSNLTGDDGTIKEVPAALDALRTAEMTELASIVEEALSIWDRFVESSLNRKSRKPPTAAKRGRRLKQDSLEAVEKALAPLDHRFYERKVDCVQQINSYIKSHPDEFLSAPGK